MINGGHCFHNKSILSRLCLNVNSYVRQPLFSKYFCTLFLDGRPISLYKLYLKSKVEHRKIIVTVLESFLIVSQTIKRFVLVCAVRYGNPPRIVQFEATCPFPTPARL